MSVRKPVMANKPSSLLSHNENETLFKLLGTRCQSLTSAIVQVFGTDGPNHNVWRKRCCGVATFTKDNTRRSYYIQVYDVIAGTRLYEQEVYNQFSYNSSMPFFHQFEAEDQMIGLNFADEGEASAFNQAVSERLAAKQRRREERKRQSDQQQRHQQHIPQQHQQQQQLGQSQQEPLKPVQPSAYVPPYVPQKEIKRKTNKRANKNKNKLSKEQIGMPMDFKHITHVGFDPDKGFSQFNVDEKLQTFFNMVGVSQQQLSDARTREFIYDFIEKNGGVEKAVQETQRYSTGPMLAGLQTDSSQLLPPTTHTSPPTPPSVPSRNSFSGSRAAPPPPPRNNHAPPPPPPVTAPPPPPPHPRAPMPPPPGQIIAGQKTTPLPPTPPSSVPPPLPPTSTIPSHPHLSAGRAAPPPPPPSVVTPSSGIVPSHPPPPPPPHPVGAGPAPPPPPPPPGGPPPPPGGPPPPPQPPGPPGALDARSALMDQIRSGSTLKKVEPVERAPVQDSRSQLLDEIRLGKSLKKVEDAEGGRNRSSEPQLEGMALDLHRALMGRALAMQSDTDSSNDDEDEDEEDEWDDED